MNHSNISNKLNPIHIKDYRSRHISLIFNYLKRVVLSSDLNLFTPTSIYRRVYNKKLIAKLTSSLNNIPQAQLALELKSDCILSFVDNIAGYENELDSESLGAKYHEFIRSSHYLSAPSNISRSQELTLESLSNLTDEDYYFRYLVEFHDIYHVLIDADSSIAGEAKLWAFCYGQVLSDYGAIINATKLLLRQIFLFNKPEIVIDIINNIAVGIKLGQEANLLFGVDWSHLLHLPLKKVRERYNINV